MKLLLDSNILLRWHDSKAPEHLVCTQALSKLAQQSKVLCVCAQVLIESYVVATRPIAANGLGQDRTSAQQFIRDIATAFPCLPEPSDMAKRWEQVITENHVMGRQAHDARIVALMLTHDVKHLVTLNGSDFARYQDVTPLSPAEALSL